MKRSSTILASALVGASCLAAGGVAAAPSCTAVFAGVFSDQGHVVWRTDGTPGGTKKIADLDTFDRPTDSASYFTNIGPGTAVFSAFSNKYGRELFVTDGLAAGTKLVTDIYRGADYDGNPSPNHTESIFQNEVRNYFTVGDRVIFAAEDNANGTELWATDGTKAGTSIVKKFGAGDDDWDGNILASNGRRALLVAEDSRVGKSIWITDGTPKGTKLVTETNTYETGFKFASRYGEDQFLFGDRNDLYVTDGERSGTKLVATFDYAVGAIAGFRKKPFALFSAYTDAAGYELWIYRDGKANLLKNLRPYEDDSYPDNFFEFGKLVYFSAIGDGEGRELWSTDGTKKNTKLVSNARKGPYSSSPDFFTRFDDTLLFRAAQSINYRLYRIGENGKAVAITVPNTFRSLTEAPFVLGSKVLLWSEDDLFVMDRSFRVTLVKQDIGGRLNTPRKDTVEICR